MTESKTADVMKVDAINLPGIQVAFLGASAVTGLGALLCQKIGNALATTTHFCLATRTYKREHAIGPHLLYPIE